MNIIDDAEIGRAVEARNSAMIALRRDLHIHPELSFKEFRTAKIVEERLKALGLDEVYTGVGDTGVVGVLRGAKPGKTLLVRADMDALPIAEELEGEYTSQNPGVMHACGHDGHVSILLALSEIMAEKRDQFAGSVKFVFQPAEEIVSGAKKMIDEGITDGVDGVIGLHLGNDIPVGRIGMRAGASMANVDNIHIRVKGKGGHGSQPEKAIDSITAAAYLITTIQTIVSREVAPADTAVVSFGTINGGFVSNVIAPEVLLTGTVRSFLPEVRELLIRRIEEIAAGVARSMRCEIDFSITYNCPAVVNDKGMTEFMRLSAIKTVGSENVEEIRPIMGSDDMALFLQKAPGCYFVVGSGFTDREVFPHHHPRFDIDERSLAIGARTMARAAFDFLS
jgi:amidohydrolase